MEQYSHYEYGELLANKLKPISHTPEHPHFFSAFGFEDLFGFEDKLSNVTGMVLIAVDGMESESSDNNGDGLTDRNEYSFIVARNTNSSRPETINQAALDCKVIAKQIRNRLFHDPTLKYSISRTTRINGIGPIGDNFYGVVLTFSLREPEDFFINSDFWED